ncbi:MAG: hypothetical protein JJT78_18130 [Leptospira sp.]|nr:hypothetical protein [Leptospira sp.]
MTIQEFAKELPKTNLEELKQIPVEWTYDQLIHLVKIRGKQITRDSIMSEAESLNLEMGYLGSSEE